MADSTAWIKKVEPEILEAVDLPKGGKEPDFPLDEFASAFSKEFFKDDISIEIGSCEWKSNDNFFNGLGNNPVSLAFEMPPLEGQLFWVMAKEDVMQIVSWFNDTNQETLSIDNPDIIKGVYFNLFLILI